MNPTNTLRGDAFRPFATLVVPGAIGLTPWSVLAYCASPIGRDIWQVHPIATGMGLFVGSLGAGFVFENLGARIELWLDRWIVRSRPDHLAIWQRYLLLTLQPEPIGQRYLRTILLRFKFELAILASIPFHLFGWVWLASETGAPTVSFVGTIIGFLVLGVWFIAEAVSSGKILGDVRRSLVMRFGDKPTGTEVVPVAATVAAPAPIATEGMLPQVDVGQQSSQHLQPPSQ